MKLKDILFEIEQNYNPILKNSIVIKTWKGPEKIANDLAYLLRKKYKSIVWI